MVNKGAIIVNGYFENESTLHQQTRLKECFEKRGIKIEIIKNNKITALIENGQARVNLGELDFIIYLDKDLHVAELLESAGYKLINSANAIRYCDDKMLTYIKLLNKNIGIPKTVSAPIMYKEVSDLAFVSRVTQEIDFPIIVKKVYGSMGRQVFKAENTAEVIEIYQNLKQFPHVYQEYIGDGYGKDTRVIVVGGKVVCAMERLNLSDFRSNIELGGKGRPTQLTKEQIKLAEKVAKTLKLDYAGVDVLTKNGKDYICEVNSNAFFKGIEDTTGVDVAGAIVEHVINKIYR